MNAKDNSRTSFDRQAATYDIDRRTEATHGPCTGRYSRNFLPLFGKPAERNQCILNPYPAMTSEKYLKEVTVGQVSALYGKVVLEEYDVAWKSIFEEEKEKIGRTLK